MKFGFPRHIALLQAVVFALALVYIASAGLFKVGAYNRAYVAGFMIAFSWGMVVLAWRFGTRFGVEKLTPEPHWALDVVLAVVGVALFAYNVDTYSGLPYLSFGSMLVHPFASFPEHVSYGTHYILPAVYQKYVLVFFLHFVGGENAVAFIENGAPFVWTAVQLLVLLGAYTCARQMTSGSGLAAVVAAIFVAGLGFRFKGVVGEAYGWVAAFAFCTLALHLFRAGSTRLWHWLLVALALVMAANMHGVAAYVACWLTAGAFLVLAREKWAIEQKCNLFQLSRVLVVAAAAFLVTYFGANKFIDEFGRGVGQEILVAPNNEKAVKGGEDWPAMYADLFQQVEEPLRPVANKGAPYYNWNQFGRKFTEPVVSGLGWNLDSRTIGFALTAAVLALCVYLGGIPLLSVASFVAICGILLLGIYLNWKSVASFPAMVFERRFSNHLNTQSLLFVVGLAGHALYRVIYTSTVRPRRAFDGVLIVVAAWIFVGFLPLKESGKRVLATGLTPPRDTQVLLEIAKVVKEQTRRDEAVLVNLRSINTLTLLTERNVISEGRGPYQQYGVMHLILQNIKGICDFSAHPSRAFLDQNNIRLVIVAKATAQFRVWKCTFTAGEIDRLRGLRRVAEGESFIAYRVVGPIMGDRL